MSRIMLIIGIIFTIISAIISYYIINNNQVQIDALRKEILQSEDNINQLWKRQQDQQQRYATSIMLYALVSEKGSSDPAKIAADDYINQTMQYYDINHERQNIKLLPEKLKAMQTKTIDSINDLYANKLSLESKMMSVQRGIEVYKIIGLFLQLLGLILVLYFKP